jgi:hypothetical protein
MMNPKILFKGENPFSDGNTYNQFVFSRALSSIRASFEMCRTD